MTKLQLKFFKHVLDFLNSKNTFLSLRREEKVKNAKCVCVCSTIGGGIPIAK